MFGKTTNVLFDEAGTGGAGSGNADTTDYKVLYETTIAAKAQADSEWQKRFGGLQATFQKEQEAKTQAVTELTTVRSMLETNTKTLETLTNEKSTLSTTVTEKEEAYNKAQAELQRKSLIMKDYPALIPFEVNGLLPQASTEELPEKLKLFSESLGSIEAFAKQKHVEGGTPPDPASKAQGAERTAAAALKDAQSASIKGDVATYQTFYKEYLELSGKESKKS
jgi:hypothetical protein